MEIKHLLINLDNIEKYLIEKGFIKETDGVSFEELGGGVSSTVIKITKNNEKSVLKQALYQLKVKAEWFAPLWRSHVEQKCLRLLSSFLPKGSVPDILFDDHENYLFIMTAAPDKAKPWKEDLLKAKINQNLIVKAGEILGLIHSYTFNNKKVRDEFFDNEIFIAGRIDPYYRSVGEKHPDLKLKIESLIGYTLTRKLALTLIDYSPKNMLVEGENVMIVDHEGAHYGDPCFDIAFFLNHLFLKAVKNSKDRLEFFKAINNFMSAYMKSQGWDKPENIESHTVPHLGVLMLARIDGKSPVEYLNESEKDIVRRISRDIILSGPEKIKEACKLTDKALS